MPKPLHAAPCRAIEPHDSPDVGAPEHDVFGARNNQCVILDDERTRNQPRRRSRQGAPARPVPSSDPRERGCKRICFRCQRSCGVKLPSVDRQCRDGLGHSQSDRTPRFSIPPRDSIRSQKLRPPGGSHSAASYKQRCCRSASIRIPLDQCSDRPRDSRGTRMSNSAIKPALATSLRPRRIAAKCCHSRRRENARESIIHVRTPKETARTRTRRPARCHRLPSSRNDPKSFPFSPSRSAIRPGPKCGSAGIPTFLNRLHKSRSGRRSGARPFKRSRERPLHNDKAGTPVHRGPHSGHK